MSEIMLQGVELMVSGMLIVFSFLALLVFAVSGLKVFVEKFFPTPVIEPKYPKHNTGVPADVVAAITIAIRQYRQKH